MAPYIDLAAAFAVGALLAAAFVAAYLHRRTEDIRADANARSRATIRGQVGEQLVPYLGEFPFNPADARFLGHPIDYVVFDGLSDDDDELEVVLVEIKSGSARLSKREAAIRDAIEAGRVRFEIVRI